MKKLLRAVSCLLMVSLLIPMLSTNVYAEDFKVDHNRFSERTDSLRQYEVAVDEAEDDNEAYYENSRKNLSIDANYWRSLGTDYFYNQLSADEKVIWDNMENSCLEVLDNTNNYDKMPKISNTAGVSLDRLTDIAWMFRYSNPQYYFLSDYVWYSSSGSYIYFEVYDIFRNGSDRKTATENFKSTIDLCVEAMSQYSQPETKEAFAHDLICNAAFYKANDYDQSAYSALCMGQTVCAGYSGAMTILCNAVGIECITLTSEYHAWNNLVLHGNWYVVDLTWDDDDDEPIWYIFYNKSNKTVNTIDEYGDHIVEAMWGNNLPNCMLDANVCIDTYAPGYAEDSNYVYFIVNDNANIGPGIAKIVECKNGASVEAAPKYITIDGGTYAVTTASSIDVQPFVNRLYEILLGRSAELEGLSAWTINLMASESTSAEIVSGIMFSDEFKGRGLSYADGVESLYQAMLGRGSDEAGKNAWINNMNNGMTYASIINGFSGSNEFAQICANYGISAGSIELTEPRDMNSDITAFIARCYNVALQRGADEDGLNGWCNVLLNGEESPKVVAWGFVFSEEVVGQNLSDADYVKLLYRLCMGREADEAGFAGWCEVLANGGTREEVFWGFADSLEFEEIIAGFGL